MSETITIEQYRAMTKAKPHKPKKAKGNKAVGEMAIILKVRFPDLQVTEEHVFHPTRKWRFDFAIVEKKIAIEYEGIFNGKSRHTTVDGYTGDTEKYNEAAKLGWKVLRYTAKSYGKLIEDLKEIL